ATTAGAPAQRTPTSEPDRPARTTVPGAEPPHPGVRRPEVPYPGVAQPPHPDVLRPEVPGPEVPRPGVARSPIGAGPPVPATDPTVAAAPARPPGDGLPLQRVQALLADRPLTARTGAGVPRPGAGAAAPLVASPRWTPAGQDSRQGTRPDARQQPPPEVRGTAQENASQDTPQNVPRTARRAGHQNGDAPVRPETAVQRAPARSAPPALPNEMRMEDLRGPAPTPEAFVALARPASLAQLAPGSAPLPLTGRSPAALRAA